MFKRLVLLATILAGSLVLSVPANAQYEGLCGIIVDPTTIAPGGQLTVSGQGAPPGATLEMLFGTTVLASDDDDGLSACSLIDAAGADTGARKLPAGTYLSLIHI